jgi:hypothetical protein
MLHLLRAAAQRRPTASPTPQSIRAPVASRAALLDGLARADPLRQQAGRGGGEQASVAAGLLDRLEL